MPTSAPEPGTGPADDRHDDASLFDFLPIGAYRSLPDGTVLRANLALARLEGYASEAELLAAVPDIAQGWYVEPDRRRQFRELLERDGQVRGFVSEVRRRRSGERFWVSENAHLVRDADGRLRHYEGTVEDITARVEAEQVLRASEQRWKLALESAGDGVWDWDLVANREVVSARLLQMYGIGPEAHDGRPDALDELTHPDDRETMRRDRDAHLRGETPTYRNEHRILCSDGRWKWVLSRGMVIERDAAGRPLRMIGTHTDISLRKEAEMLRREREHAAEAQKAQNAFLSRVSHELRTPLNAIIGFAQLLELEPAESPRRPVWVRTLLDSGRQLLALVNDLLDLSSARTGLLQFTRTSVEIGPLLREVWVLHATDAAHAGLAFADSAGAAAGLRVMADPRRLRQVLSNLVSNAIKYNRPGGRVRVSARRDGEAVALSVEDDGPGLDAAQLERLFQPFERLGAQHTPIAGTGLGLALARQLVEAMGGTIEVDSTPGRGSRFTVRLEAAAATPLPEASGEASAVRT